MNRRHVPFLDHFRGVAILLVVIFHALVPAFNRNQLEWNGCFRDFAAPLDFLLVLPATFGWCGVAIFFVVSGFCIHLSYLGSPVWRDFFIRRFFRIYPPYLAVLVFFVAFFPGRRLHLSVFGDLVQFVTHAVLVHNFDARTLYGIVGSFWSIAVEVQLYVLYPLLVMLAMRWGWRGTLAGTAVVEIALRVAGSIFTEPGVDMPKFFTGLPFTYWFSWAIGVALAEAHFHHRPLPFAKWPLSVLLAASLGSAFFQPLANFSFPFFALLTAASIAKLLSGVAFPVKVPELVAKHLRTAGTWSYSIYLLHQPIVEAVPSALVTFFPTTHFSALVKFAICASSWFVMLPLAGAWYWAFERTSIRLSKRFTVRRGEL